MMISLGHEAIVDMLIKSGANVNRDDNNQTTPLHNAAENGISKFYNNLQLEKPNLKIKKQLLSS